MRVKFKNSRGNDATVTFEKVKFVPQLKLNLFSLALGMKDGWKVESIQELCNTSFRLILVIIQKLKLPAWSLDIETAFLNGDLTEEIFKKVPDGFNQIHGEGKVSGKILRLNKSIYGLVQAARQWHERFSEEILKLGFQGNNVDPCLFYKKEEDEICILCIYVDDGIITGSEKLMEKTIKCLNVSIKSSKSSWKSQLRTS